MSEDETTEDEILEDILEPEVSSLASSSSSVSSPLLLSLEYKENFTHHESLDKSLENELKDGEYIKWLGVDTKESDVFQNVYSDARKRRSNQQVESQRNLLETKSSSSVSEEVMLYSPTLSPPLSRLSVVSQARGKDPSDPHNDRSLSEMSVTFPNFTVFDVGSKQRVSSLVKQFSQKESGSLFHSTNELRHWQSLPSLLIGDRSSLHILKTEHQPSSLIQGSVNVKDKVPSSNSRVSVSRMVSHFSLEGDESPQAEKCKKHFWQKSHSIDKNDNVNVISSANNPACDNVAISSNTSASEEIKAMNVEFAETVSLKELDNIKAYSVSVDTIRRQTSLQIEIESCEKKLYGNSFHDSSDCQLLKGDVSVDNILGINVQKSPRRRDIVCDNLNFLCNLAFPAASQSDDIFPQKELMGKPRISLKTRDLLQPSFSENEVEPNFHDENDHGSRSESFSLKKTGEIESTPLCDSPNCMTENDTCEELLEIDIGEYDQDAFTGDLSEASEIILGFVSKSPISAITERTEESGQDMEKFLSEECKLQKECQAPVSLTRDTTVSVEADVNKDSQVEEIEMKPAHQVENSPLDHEYFPSHLESFANEIESSQFMGMSLSMQEESLAQTQASLDAQNTAVPSSSQSSNEIHQKRGKLGPTPRWTKYLPCSKLNKVKLDSCSTPPLTPPPGYSFHGPIKRPLHRITSKSMHNLALAGGCNTPGAGTRGRYQRGLQNRSFSLSTDHLERQSPRAKSLSPGPLPEQRMRPFGESCVSGMLSRRCVSAVALHRVDSQGTIRRHQSMSLNRLNGSHSSSMTSIGTLSWKKPDYSHIPSKVKQYIKDMKDKDMRKSTRSLPTTPAKMKSSALSKAHGKRTVVDEVLFHELYYLEEKDIPETIKRLKEQLIRSKSNFEGLDELLQLWTLERKLRYASDTTLATLQEHYDNLNALYAEKQNEIDRLRFFRHSHINQVYNIPFKINNEKMAEKQFGEFGRSSCHTTPPNTPCNSITHFFTSPNTPTRRSSLQAASSNLPAVLSLSSTPFGMLVKSSSTPTINHTWSPTCELKETTSVAASDSPEAAHPETVNKDQSRKDVRDASSTISLEQWVRDANSVLKRVKEFALLKGSSALQPNETNLIWQSILTQAFIKPCCMSPPFQYWQLSAQFPVLSLIPGSHQASGLLVQSLGQALSGTASRFDLELVPSGNIAELDSSEQARLSVAVCIPESEGVGAGPFLKERQSICSAEPKSSGAYTKTYSPVLATGDCPQPVNFQSSSLSRGLKRMCNDEIASIDSNMSTKCLIKSFGAQRNGIPEQGRPLNTESKSQCPVKPNSELRCSVSESDPEMNWKYPSVVNHEDNLVNTDGEPGAVQDIGGKTSPAPSQESMKTVGPLEKVTMWQESLIGSCVPQSGSYQLSSNLSPENSLISLSSGQAYNQIPSNIDQCLTDIQLEGNASVEAAALTHAPDEVEDGSDHLKRISSGRAVEVVDSGSQSLLNCQERLEYDLPKNSWKGNLGGAPLLALGRSSTVAVNARDLDSGCPGSERSAKLSHNASLENPLLLDTLESETNVLIPTYMSSSSIKNSQVQYSVSIDAVVKGRSNVSEYEDGDVSETSLCHENENRNIPEVMLDSEDSNVKPQNGVGKGNSVLLSKSLSNSSITSISLETSSDEDIIHQNFRKSKGHRSLNRLNVGDGERNEMPKVAASARDSRKFREKQKNSSPDKDFHFLGKTLSSNSNQASIHKYEEKYIKDPYFSDSSSVGSNSSVDVVNNISKLKRDLSILKSQMLNLNDEVCVDRHKRMQKPGRNSNEPRGSKCKPLKAIANIYTPQPHTNMIKQLNSSLSLEESKSMQVTKQLQSNIIKIRSHDDKKASEYLSVSKMECSPNSDRDSIMQYGPQESNPSSNLLLDSEVGFQPDVANQLEEPSGMPSGASRKLKDKRKITRKSFSTCDLCEGFEPESGIRNKTELRTDYGQQRRVLTSPKKSEQSTRVPLSPVTDKLNRLIHTDTREALLQTERILNIGQSRSEDMLVDGGVPRTVQHFSPQCDSGNLPSTPVIYIKNYNCGIENSATQIEEARSPKAHRMKSPHRNDVGRETEAKIGEYVVALEFNSSSSVPLAFFLTVW
ncbi:hypothetical protein SK128_024650 [Halocaridina rubra]|uniref:Uncharacterized protein n=1 Tax=Halocaridina rubra TaxID=373956 RepID=A0AAN8X4T4_HALRR